MKKIKWLIPVIISICFTSCLDTVEDLQIKENGSGVLNINMDMSKAAEMLKGFIGQDSAGKENLGKVLDTTVMLNDKLDTVKNMSAETKALMRDGKVHINMNLAANILKMDMNIPFRSQADLEKLYSSIQKEGLGLNSIMKSATGGESTTPMPDTPVEPETPQQPSNVYDVFVKNGQYRRVLNKERFEKYKMDPKTEEMRGMSAMLGEMTYTINLSLPRPVKKVSNSKAVISNDKKHVMLKNDIYSVFDHPEESELTVDY